MSTAVLPITAILYISRGYQLEAIKRLVAYDNEHADKQLKIEFFFEYDSGVNPGLPN